METRAPLDKTTTSPKRLTSENALHQTEGACEPGFIWRTRSLDESTRPASNDKSCGCQHEGKAEESSETSGVVAALHTSFDAAFLDADRDQPDIFRRSKLDTPQAASYDDESDPTAAELLSGRKHVRQPSLSDSAGSFQPGTVRKFRRRAAHVESAKTPVRPKLPQGGSWKKSVTSTTPSSSSRRRRPTTMKSPMSRRVPPSTPRETFLQRSNSAGAMQSNLQQLPDLPWEGAKSEVASRSFTEKSKSNFLLSLTPSRPQSSTFKAPINRVSHSGTVNHDCSATQETDSLGTASPAGAMFRFTSFPASLPRVNNPRISSNGDMLDIPRRRITDHLGIQQPQLREDDGTHNTSISSLSGGEVGAHYYQQQQHHQLASTYPPPILEWKSPEDTKDETNDSAATDQFAFAEPVHSKLFLDDDMYGYSDDDDSDHAPAIGGSVGRTRLDFNLVLGGDDPDDMRDGTPETPLFGRINSIDLSRPIEQKRVSSFPSSVSSSSPLRTLSGCDEITTASTSAMTPSRSGVGSAPTDHADQPGTPRDVKLHFQLNSAQCSPIFGVPDESDAHPNTTSLTLQPNKDVKTSGESIVSSQDKSHSSNDSRASTGSHKMRRLRPMPDMSAFEQGVPNGQERSGDDSTGRVQPSSPRLLCPPTPVRTPAWAHNDSFGNGILPRANSLIISKVLATCPPRVVDKRSSLEISLMDDDRRTGMPPRRPHSMSNRQPIAMTDEDDSEVSTVVDSPESPVSMEHDDETDDKQRRQVFESASERASTRFPFFPAHSPCERRTALHTEAVDPSAVHSHEPPAAEDGNAVVSFALDFEVIGELGRGAFADVYKVRSKSDNQLYAVKRNRRQFRGKRDRDLALSEVQTMQRLQNVCTEESGSTTSYSLYLLFFYRAWQEDGHFFSQTELCCRDTCREMIQSLRSMWPDAKKKYPSLLKNLETPPGVIAGSEGDIGGRLIPNMTVWKICHDVAAGLSHIHSHRIVHNDIKPSNLFFVEHMRFGAMCKIGDFGMAGNFGTAEDGQEGDTMYMPPELLSSVVKQPGIDIFSLGLTLYEVASAALWELPADGPLWHDLRSGNHNPDLPPPREPEMAQLIRSMIDPEPHNRPSAEQVLSSYPMVKTAGAGCDTFLRDYLLDVETFDRIQEQQRLQEFSGQQDQTPRNALTTDRRVLTIRSPDMVPLAPLLFSPKSVGIK